MKDITVPIIPLEKEDEITEKILQSSATAEEDPLPSIKSIELQDDEYDFWEEVELILLGMGMEKYFDLFKKSGVTLETFMQLDEIDLRELGVADKNDILKITNNLKIYHGQGKKFELPENLAHDLQIAKNVSNELTLLQNYCKYLELQMRKSKLTDYRINLKESASTYLKAFTEAAVLQARIICKTVYKDSGEDHLIGNMLKLNQTLTNELKEKLRKEKTKDKRKINGMVVILGVLSLVLLFTFYKKSQGV